MNLTAKAKKACHTMAMKVFIDNFAFYRQSPCLAYFLLNRKTNKSVPASPLFFAFAVHLLVILQLFSTFFTVFGGYRLTHFLGSGIKILIVLKAGAG
jgi:hypothetical protein